MKVQIIEICLRGSGANCYVWNVIRLFKFCCRFWHLCVGSFLWNIDCTYKKLILYFVVLRKKYKLTVFTILTVLRGSVLDFPKGFGALLAHTFMPWTLWMLVSNVGVKDRLFKLYGLKSGGKSTSCCFLFKEKKRYLNNLLKKLTNNELINKQVYFTSIK